MNTEYKKKLEGLGFDLQKITVCRLWTTDDGRYITPVVFDKSIFTEIGEFGTVATVIDIMNRRIKEKYGLNSEEFEVSYYYGDGKFSRLIATVFIAPAAVNKVLEQNEFYCN